MSDIGPTRSSCFIVALRFFLTTIVGNTSITFSVYISIYKSQSRIVLFKAYISQLENAIFVSAEYINLPKFIS